MLPIRIPMRWVEKRILMADTGEMDSVLQWVISWHKRRFPEEELVVWSLPVNDRLKRKLQIEMAMGSLNLWCEDAKR